MVNSQDNESPGNESPGNESIKENLKELQEKSFWEVKLNLPKDFSPQTQEFFIQSGALGFHELLYQDGVTKNLDENDTIHYYYFSIEFPVQAFVPMAMAVLQVEPYRFEIREVFYRDFLKTIQDTFRPFWASKKFQVIAPHLMEEAPYNKDDQLVQLAGQKKVKPYVIINPAFAFGTGRHATTQGVMEVLELLEEQGFLKDAAIFEMGCGSGILCIFALILGAQKAVGVDVETLSVESSQENYGYNVGYHKLPLAAEFYQGDFSRHEKNNAGPEGGLHYDIFISNILPDVFYQNENALKHYLQKAPIWILSGIIREKKEEFLIWLNGLGVIEEGGQVQTLEKDGWMVFYKIR